MDYAGSLLSNKNRPEVFTHFANLRPRKALALDPQIESQKNNPSPIFKRMYSQKKGSSTGARARATAYNDIPDTATYNTSTTTPPMSPVVQSPQLKPVIVEEEDKKSYSNSTNTYISFLASRWPQNVKVSIE